MAIFNVKNYGAKGNGTTDDRAAIQKALDAAFNAGGGDVYLPKGIYAIGNGGQKPTYAGLQIKDNVHVYGDGMGETVIKVKDGTSGGMTGIMRSPYARGTHDFSVRDLTLDGNRDHTTGKVDGWFNGFAPEQEGKDYNLTLLRVEIKDCSGYGFDPHEQTENILIKDCVSHGNGLDGFVADFQFNGKFQGNLAYDNDRHGYNIVTSTYNFQLVDNIARDNRGGGIVVQRGTNDIPSPHDILIQGGKVYGNALEGVLVKLSDKVTVTGAEIYDNGTAGIRLFGSKGSIIYNNKVHDNSQSKDGGYDEIRLEAYDDTGTRYSNTDGTPVTSGGHLGKFFATSGTRIHDNQIYDSNSTVIKAGWGVKEKLFGATNPGVFDNDVINNLIYGTKNGMVQLVGNGSDQSGNTSDDGIPDGNQLIVGGPEDGVHTGGNGNDTIDGGGGKDTLTGNAGKDVFKFSNLADSVDTNAMYDHITDFNVVDDKIDVRGLGFTGFVTTGLTQEGELRLVYSAANDRSYIRSDQSTFEFYLDGDYRTTLTASNFMFDSAPNHAPVVNYPLVDQIGTEGQAFTYQFANITFTDQDGDALTFTAKQANNTALPSWLTFNATTQTFSGTPTSIAAGSYDITVTANDGRGGVISDTFKIDISDAPVVDPLTGDDNANNLLGTNANELLRGNGGLDTLNGGDGNDTLDGGAGKDTLTGGNGSDVFKFSDATHSTETDPDRITDFDVAQDKIDLSGLGFTSLVSGTKTNAGELRLAYSAANDRTYVRSDQSTFEFYLQGDYRATLTNANFIFNAAGNHNPIVGASLVDQATSEDQAFTYTFAANSFTDADGDALTYTAKLANNAALPAWLNFDAANRTFSGTPTSTASGQYNIVVTADDNHGGTVSDEFIFNVTDVNHAPTVSVPLVDQNGTEGQAFTYQFVSSTFSDSDGDALTYTAKLASNAALPAWLTFDAANRTFSGTPTDTASGQYNIVVTANDGKGGTVSDEFVFNVADVAPANHAPVVAVPLVDQNGTEGQAFSYQFAAGSFTDQDAGDTLTYTAKLTGGAALPAWLAFDAANRTFSGTPTDTASGAYSIVVTANDGHGGIVDDTFIFNVADVVTPPAGTPISGDNNANNLLGTTGNDVILGNGGNDTLSGLGGNDTLDGGAGKDTLTGGEGADVFKFSNLSHSVESALDRITDFDVTKDKIDLSGLGFTKFVTTSGTQIDELRLSYSSTGNKSLIKSDKLTFEIQLDGDYRGKLTNDNFIFNGGSSTPTTPGGGSGGQGDITGTDSGETLTGTPANEHLFGLGGNDTLIGNFGNDTLDGGSGADQLTGNEGSDVFAFLSLTHSTETKLDHITDFEVGVDKIDLRGLGFTDFVTKTTTGTGELRLAYSGATDRSYIRSDQSTFEFYLDGDYRGHLTHDDFIFS
ncbi:MAG: putative Ig domain-containing protein [Rickettsiales bacterium]